MNDSADDRLRAELQQIERELDRELLHHDLHPSPGDRRPASPARPRALLRWVERSVLAGVSLLALALGLQALDHHCPEPPPVPPMLTAPLDAGAPADSAPEQADDEPPSEAEEATCPVVEAEEKREWVSIHLLLTAVTEAKATSWSEPIDWELTIPPQLAGFFPAVSRDGRTVVQIFDDIQDFSANPIRRMVFFSVPTGKVIRTFILHSGGDKNPSASDAATAQEILQRWESDRTAANRLLDATEWRHLATARTPSRPCPGTPWERLDEERSRSEEWRSHQAARFDAEGIDLEFDPEHNTLTVRALQKDGTLRTVLVDYAPEGPGRSATGGHCGEVGGIAGFGSRELGAFFLFGTDENLGGDSCVGIDTALRTGLFRLPRGL
jgi:hypothetical protein